MEQLKLIFTFLLLFYNTITFAQFNISGKVIDTTGSPIDAAIVVLMNPEDGTTIQQQLTSENGEFSLKVKGEIKVYVSCMGYKTYLSEAISVNNDIILPDIMLTAEDFTLQDVIVIGEKQTSSVKMEHGKLIFTPRNSSILAGAIALETLKKTPGVFVDGNNNISIGGRKDVLVVVNGKATYMQKNELVSMLKSTPSSAINSIEVIQNPSSQYDAEGSGGIININMRNNKTEGLSISANNGVSYWYNLRQNTDLSISYTSGKLSLTGNYNHALGHYNMDYGMHRIQGGKYYYSPTEDTDKRRTITGNIGLEYTISNKRTIGIRLDANTLSGPGITSTITEIRNLSDNKLEKRLYAQNDYYSQRGNRYGTNIYYISKPSKETSYNVDFNYAWFDGGSGNWQPNRYEKPNGDIEQDKQYKSENKRNIHIYALSYNQQHKLWSGEIKSGAKLSYVNADNGYRIYDVTGSNQHLDKTQSNDFRYKERIFAAYLMFSRNLGNRLSIEGGLRGEYTFSDGKLTTVNSKNNEENKKQYFNLFPSVSLNYNISDNNTLTLNYSSRIDRPAYQDLNPFEYLLDELSSWKGNPFLTPQRTHSIAVTYNHKQTAITASFAHTNNYKAQITDTIALKKVMMIPRNIGMQQRMSLSLFQSLAPIKGWEMSFNLVGYYVRNDIAFDKYRQFNLDGFAGVFSIQNSIRLPWRIMLELNGSYSTKHLGASNEYNASSGFVDAGVSRTFNEKKWTVSLSMTDIFWTSRWDNHSSIGDFQLWNWGRSETRQVKLNVTYKFGKQKQTTRVSSFEEIDRL